MHAVMRVFVCVWAPAEVGMGARDGRREEEEKRLERRHPACARTWRFVSGHNGCSAAVMIAL